MSLTIAIPTYRREHVLVETVQSLLPLLPAAAEILVLDQTRGHSIETEAALEDLHRAGTIRWLRLPEPSIPRAMNRGLLEARHAIVLFVDDDVVPEPGLISAHLAAHAAQAAALVAGRVIQPWQEGVDFSGDARVHFAAVRPAWVDEFIGCNFSVRREPALALGGFDENFVRVAYRFEAEFSWRWLRAGHRIYFEPAACLHHLKVGAGGTRSFGEYLTTWKPDHAVGANYHLFRTWQGWPSLVALLSQPWRAIATRHHLRRPWWVPVSLVAEAGACVWALGLLLRGPRHVTRARSTRP